MKSHHKKAGKKFRQAMSACQDIHVSQAVNHQHSHNRIRQHPGQIQDEPGRLPLSPENQKRSGPKSQRHKGSHCHQQRRVQIDPHSLPSSLFLNTVSSTVITAIAGIIKESVPAVCGWLPPEAIAVVQGACGEKHSRLYQAADFFPSDGELPETSLYGYYQRRNAAVALQTVRVLRRLAKEGKAPELFDISDESAKKALSDVSWAARWQTIPLQNGARLILDSSHNEEGAKTLDSNLSELSAELKSQGKKLPIISVGVLGRERAIPLFKVIVKYARKIILLVPKQPRALDFKELEECIGDCGVEISQMRVEDLYGKGLRCSQVSPGDTIVCTGSIYLAGEVLAALGGKIPDGLQDIPYGK